LENNRPEKKPHNLDGNPESETSAFIVLLERNNTWNAKVEFLKIMYFWGKFLKNQRPINNPEKNKHFWTKSDQTSAFTRV